MKRNIIFIILSAISIFIFSYPVYAGEMDVSGSFKVLYRNSDKIQKSYGDDILKPIDLYIQIKKEVVPEIDALIKIDGADMNNVQKNTITHPSNNSTETIYANTHEMLEEAQVIFKMSPVMLIFGKDEMPFGQDYEKFLYGTLTHGYEIDKVWGINSMYNIDKFGLIEAAFFKKDATSETGLFKSYAARFTIDKFINGFSIEASYGKKGKDEASTTSVDEDRVSIGSKYSFKNFTIHVENTSFTKYIDSKGVQTQTNPSVLQVGADYLILEKCMAKTFYEIRNDDVSGDQAGSIKNHIGIGLSHFIQKEITVALEYIMTNYEADHVTYKEKSVGEVIIGIAMKF